MPISIVPRELDQYTLKNETLFRRRKQKKTEEEKQLKPSEEKNDNDLFKAFLSNACSVHYFCLFAWFAIGLKITKYGP